MGISDINSDRAEHVDGSKCNCERGRDTERNDADQRTIQCKDTGKGESQREKRKGDGELAFLSNNGDEGTASSRLPNLVQ